MRLICLTLLALVATAPLALADESYDQCLAAPAADASACAKAQSERQQALVETRLKEIADLTDGAVKAALEAEQTAWLAFLEKSCAFMLDTAFAPQGDQKRYYECRDAVIADRARQVEVYGGYIDN